MRLTEARPIDSSTACTEERSIGMTTPYFDYSLQILEDIYFKLP